MGARRGGLSASSCSSPAVAIPSLGLLVDEPRDSDLVEEVDGLTFLIDPQTRELAGAVSIAYRPEASAFVLTSANPIGEWDGMVTCNLRL